MWAQDVGSRDGVLAGPGLQQTFADGAQGASDLVQPLNPQSVSRQEPEKVGGGNTRLGSLRSTLQWAGHVARLVECFPGVHKVLGLVPSPRSKSRSASKEDTHTSAILQ